jgi:hypothetical protein
VLVNNLAKENAPLTIKALAEVEGLLWLTAASPQSCTNPLIGGAWRNLLLHQFVFPLIRPALDDLSE